MMQVQTYSGQYVICETADGTEYVPISLCESTSHEDLQAYCVGMILDSEISSGVLARLSAPGYLDSTEWLPFPSIEEATASLTAME